MWAFYKILIFNANIMKKNTAIFTVSMLLLTVVLSSCGWNNTQNTNTSLKTNNTKVVQKGSPIMETKVMWVDSDKDWIPDAAEKVLWTDPKNPDTDWDWINDKTDKNPTFADNFVPSKWKDWLKINKILVENNVDPVTKKGTSDHLEIFATNTTNSPISDLTLYYKDIDNSGAVAPQSYIIYLTGLTLQPNKETSIHVDTSWKSGHFRANPNSMYYLDKNGQTFDVTLNAKWFNATTKTIKKDPGGAELAD